MNKPHYQRRFITKYCQMVAIVMVAILGMMWISLPDNPVLAQVDDGDDQLQRSPEDTPTAPVVKLLVEPSEPVSPTATQEQPLSTTQPTNEPMTSTIVPVVPQTPTSSATATQTVITPTSTSSSVPSPSPTTIEVTPTETSPPATPVPTSTQPVTATATSSTSATAVPTATKAASATATATQPVSTGEPTATVTQPISTEEPTSTAPTSTPKPAYNHDDEFYDPFQEDQALLTPVSQNEPTPLPTVTPLPPATATLETVFEETETLSSAIEPTGIPISVTATTTSALVTPTPAKSEVAIAASTPLDAESKNEFYDPFQDANSKDLAAYAQPAEDGTPEENQPAPQAATVEAFAPKFMTIIPCDQERINICHLVFVALHYGNDESSADMNQDNVVDLQDLMMISTRYNQPIQPIRNNPN